MKYIYSLITLFITSSVFSQSTFMTPVESNVVPNRSQVETIVASIGYQGYEEGQEYFGQGEFEIFLDVVDGVLDQPIIILDGFDPGDARDIGGLYNSFDFDGQNLADILREEGFDIVILNAPQYTTGGKDIDGGADYIQRNAFVLIELINLINDQKEGDGELVVFGPSMGGLIGRYALAYMEDNGMDPETRLYISFDAPHRGANIPMSLQYLINYLARSVGDPDATAIIENVLNSPAAKEMLIDHLLAHLLAGSDFEQDPTKLLPEGAPNFRDAFQAELDALGFPETVRNVTMVNGSGNSATTGTPGMQVVNTNLDLGNFLTADVSLHFMPEAGMTNNITFFETFLFGISVDLFEADAEAFSFTDGVDSAPGGTANISSALGAAGNNQVIIDFIMALDQDDYSFIPTISALAIDNEDDWYVAPDIGGIHTSGFVNTFIPAVNESHVQVTPENAQFALDEIRLGVLGISDISLRNKYRLDRNPVGEQIKLILDGSRDYTDVRIAAYAVTGQQVLFQKLPQASNEIVLDHRLDAGIYMMEISDSEGTHNLKFVVGR
ncbi:MAG: T9SS type A sorting domain-containing protein [Bacteroidota bacterium]